MHLPHLKPFGNGTIVFITVCTHAREPLLASPVVHTTIREVWNKSAQLNGWFVGRYVLMPDHVHLFACPGQGAVSLADWIQLWKTITAKSINRTLSRRGALWQADYFDRFLRSLRDYEQKWDYVVRNPVRKKLVTDHEHWPYSGIIHDLRHISPRD